MVYEKEKEQTSDEYAKEINMIKGKSKKLEDTFEEALQNKKREQEETQT